MVKVSVIVPCLNMEQYVNDCLQSILNQSMTQLEILVVDAGSTDGTLNILNGYERLDSRVKVLHSPKKSYGYQVNMGIRHAMGQYVAIVDADDKIEKHMYEMLYEVAVQEDVDYAKGAVDFFVTITDDLAYRLPFRQFAQEAYQNGRVEVIPQRYPKLLTIDPYLWTGLYKLDFIREVHLHESSGAAFQDFGALLQTQMKAAKAVYISEPFYQYRQDNISASRYNKRGFEYVWSEYSWAEKAFMQEANQAWKAEFYKKWFFHTLNRYFAMAATGEIWDGAVFYINLIRQKLQSKLLQKDISKSDFEEKEWGEMQQFLEGEYVLFEQYFKRHQQARNELKEILMMTKDKQVVIFGYGKYGKFIHAQLLYRKNGEIKAYCDNASAICDRYVEDVLIVKPQEAFYLFPTACYIIASKNHNGEMKEQLLHLGVPLERICSFTTGVDMGLFGDQLI